MKNKILLAFSIALALSFLSCSSIQTRLEEDVYTVSVIDTTDKYFAVNAPENRDRGVVYPSSRRFETERVIVTKDSVVERYYPDFIRLGVFESVGLLFGGDPDLGLGTGMFGIFPDVENIKPEYEGSDGFLFKGGMYKFGIGEWRLRWFRDAKNWTWGVTLFEIIAPDARIEKALMSPTFNIRKRYYFREKIPYVSFSPGVSFGIFPSVFVNLNGAFELGSIGGFNIRAYLGLAAGTNMKGWGPEDMNLVELSNRVDESQTSIIPYAGIGMSFLDFHNLVPETEKEWKDYDHSSWDVGLFQFGLIGAGQDQSVFGDSTKSILSGAYMRLLNASVALPILDNNFYVGSSLFNILAIGENAWGLGVLPIRAGYFATVIPDELTAEPFIEYNYYPTSFFNIGGRINLKIPSQNYLNFSVLIGYASGSASSDIDSGSKLNKNFGASMDWSGAYVGIGIGLFDRIFYPREVRYNK